MRRWQSAKEINLLDPQFAIKTLWRLLAVPVILVPPTFFVHGFRFWVLWVISAICCYTCYLWAFVLLVSVRSGRPLAIVLWRKKI